MSKSEKVRKSGGHIPVIAIGPTISGCDGHITGQAMMFQLIVDVLQERGWAVRVYNIAEKRRASESRTIGGFSMLRMMDYMKLIPSIWGRLIMSGKCIVYLTTAQSRMGFMRDMCIIWATFLRGDYLVCHQFGGNYGGFYNSQRSIIRFLIRKTLNLATTIIVEGEFVKEQLSFVDEYRKKVSCVTNGLPERSIEIAETAKEIEPGKPFRLIYLSNMIESKGYWDVLKAVKILRSRSRNVFCRFAGKFMSDSAMDTSPEQSRRDFFQYIEDNQLSDHVSYTEGLLGRDKFNAFRESHLFLLPSNYLHEGQPVSILEAMAHGAVTIATNYRLIPVMVEDNNTGFFVPYDDPEAIAGKVEYLMDNPKEYKRMSSNSIERFCKSFQAESYVERMTTAFIGATGQSA